jgi:REP element-mobilizing transposase RayT
MRIDRPERKILRLKGYDYSSPGSYFVTTCTQYREKLFGEVRDEKMFLSDAGKVVQICWQEIPEHYPGVHVDAFVVMPDHVHGIIAIGAGAIHESPRTEDSDAQVRRRMLIPLIIGRFKQNSAKLINKMRRVSGVAVWERSYYESIIRDQKSLFRIRAYILRNPECWSKHSLRN